MSAKDQGEQGGVWPAYVAAMAGLVQSLLFVSAIMALALLQIGMLVGRQVDQQQADRWVGEGRKAQRLQGSPQARASVPSPSSERWSVEFDDSSVWLSEQARAELQALVRRQLEQGHRSWRLEVWVEADNVLQRRAAYLRLLVMRNAMVEAGVDSTQIQMSIREVDAAAAGVSAKVIRLTPSRSPLGQAPAPGRPEAAR